jgi:ParB family chromosome partitioning protein
LCIRLVAALFDGYCAAINGRRPGAVLPDRPARVIFVSRRGTPVFGNLVLGGTVMSKHEVQPRRLGRGLSSLINVSDTPIERTIAPNKPGASAPDTAARQALVESPTSSPSFNAVLDLSIESIVPNPHQPRRTMNEASLNELAASIKATGVIQPILVRRTADGQTQLIAGERRWRASKLAGLTTIPAIVREVDVFTQAQMALIENIQREDLNPIDRALGYRTLIQQLGLTQQELAGRLGEDRTAIGHYVRLLDLPATVQEMIKDARLSLGHAKQLASVADAAEQQRLAQLVLAQGLSVRNLEKVILGSGGGAKKSKVAAGNSIHLADLEKRIATAIGMRAQIRTLPKTTSKGRLVIHYANLDQFDDLIAKLGVKLED